ncbi:adenosine-specific kinase [Bradyrhizobium oligotrophicum S58]
MELAVVPIVKPDAANVVFGQSHFIKAVEYLHGAGGAVQGIRFGLGDAAFRHIACQKESSRRPEINLTRTPDVP